MAQDPETVVRAFFARLTSGKMLEAIEEYTTEDCIWENSGLPTAPDRAAMLQMMKAFIDSVQMQALVVDLHALAVSGDAVLTERTDHMDAAGGKRVMSFPLAGVLRVRNGKIYKWSDYFDPRPILPPGA